MSIQILSAVRDCGPRELTRFSVLETLANYADDFGFCFPGMQTIAWESRCDERTVRRQIVELEREGWLFVTRKVLNGKANVYQLNLSKIGVTASPTAKRSPVFTRLLKLYPDTMSPIFAVEAVDPRDVREHTEKPVASFFVPEKSPDTDGFSEDNPQPLTGHSRPNQRTFEGGSEDIACPPNRYNHQEPSIEPSTILKDPPTPLGGVELDPVEIADPGQAARWGRFLVALKAELSGVTGAHAGGRFREIVPGENDFETCFRDWWLEELTISRTSAVLVTRARDPVLTRQGLEKYRRRVDALLSDRLGVGPGCAMVIGVRSEETHNPAV